MHKVRFISYLRVSTDRQGKSGLGLEAQRKAVARHVSGKGEIVAEHEARMISERTRGALAVAKERGIALGWAIPGRAEEQRLYAYACRYVARERGGAAPMR